MMFKRYIILCIIVEALVGCALKVQDAERLQREVSIYPDYTDVTMPCNMAAPTFTLNDSALQLSDVQAVFRAGSKTVVVADIEDEGVCIDANDWQDLVCEAKGGAVSITVQGTKDGKWVEYNPFDIFISNDSIDSYLSYRLIEPGYEVWGEMGIYQRNLTNYDEKALITNDKTEGGCINCHSYANYDANTMSLHMRKTCSGTYIKKNGKTKKMEPQPTFVYPSWHPGGRYIAYSQNVTKQRFHTTDRNRIEVFDYASDVIVFDTENGDTLKCPLLMSKAQFETFPSWSADGRRLYFCSADSVTIPEEYDKAHYSLCSVAFNPETGEFGTNVDTIYNARIEGKSVSFPRESPDGRFLMFTLHNYGNFSIWHKESRTVLLDMQGSLATELNKQGSLNSIVDKQGSPTSRVAKQESLTTIPFRSSYHSWSSTGRWIVMSSREADGLYTRPYILHCDKDGKLTKPFPIPQKDAYYALKLMKSYNIPEFTKNEPSFEF